MARAAPERLKLCPKCQQELILVARGAHKCPQCAGIFAAPSAVHAIAGDDASEDAAAVEDSEGGLCPEDRSILSRATIDVGDDRPPVHLERCSSCRGVWFDAGEWTLLAEHHLLDNLDAFWTAEWRAQQRRRADQANREKRDREAFGPELHHVLLDLAARLKGHERRSQALAFLREASDE